MTTVVELLKFIGHDPTGWLVIGCAAIVVGALVNRSLCGYRVRWTTRRARARLGPARRQLDEKMIGEEVTLGGTLACPEPIHRFEDGAAAAISTGRGAPDDTDPPGGCRVTSRAPSLELVVGSIPVRLEGAAEVIAGSTEAHPERRVTRLDDEVVRRMVRSQDGPIPFHLDRVFSFASLASGDEGAARGTLRQSMVEEKESTYRESAAHWILTAADEQPIPIVAAGGTTLSPAWNRLVTGAGLGLGAAAFLVFFALAAAEPVADYLERTSLPRRDEPSLRRAMLANRLRGDCGNNLELLTRHRRWRRVLADGAACADRRQPRLVAGAYYRLGRFRAASDWLAAHTPKKPASIPTAAHDLRSWAEIHLLAGKTKRAADAVRRLASATTWVDGRRQGLQCLADALVRDTDPDALSRLTFAAARQREECRALQTDVLLMKKQPAPRAGSTNRMPVTMSLLSAVEGSAPHAYQARYRSPTWLLLRPASMGLTTIDLGLRRAALAAVKRRARRTDRTRAEVLSDLHYRVHLEAELADACLMLGRDDEARSHLRSQRKLTRSLGKLAPAMSLASTCYAREGDSSRRTRSRPGSGARTLRSRPSTDLPRLVDHAVLMEYRLGNLQDARRLIATGDGGAGSRLAVQFFEGRPRRKLARFRLGPFLEVPLDRPAWYAVADGEGATLTRWLQRHRDDGARFLVAGTAWMKDKDVLRRWIRWGDSRTCRRCAVDGIIDDLAGRRLAAEALGDRDLSADLRRVSERFARALDNRKISVPLSVLAGWRPGHTRRKGEKEPRGAAELNLARRKLMSGLRKKTTRCRLRYCEADRELKKLEDELGIARSMEVYCPMLGQPSAQAALTTTRFRMLLRRASALQSDPPSAGLMACLRGHVDRLQKREHPGNRPPPHVVPDGAWGAVATRGFVHVGLALERDDEVINAIDLLPTHAAAAYGALWVNGRSRVLPLLQKTLAGSDAARKLAVILSFGSWQRNSKDAATICKLLSPCLEDTDARISRAALRRIAATCGDDRLEAELSAAERTLGDGALRKGDLDILRTLGGRPGRSSRPPPWQLLAEGAAPVTGTPVNPAAATTARRRVIALLKKGLANTGARRSRRVEALHVIYLLDPVGGTRTALGLKKDPDLAFYGADLLREHAAAVEKLRRQLEAIMARPRPGARRSLLAALRTLYLLDPQQGQKETRRLSRSPGWKKGAEAWKRGAGLKRR